MNRTLAEHRAARATELARQGLTYDAIARQLGYADPSGAWRAVRRCLKHRQQVAADDYINGGLADLQVLVESHWRRAVLGEQHAAELVLSALERQRRLLELQSKQDSQNPQPAKRPNKGQSRRAAEVGAFASMIV